MKNSPYTLLVALVSCFLFLKQSYCNEYIDSLENYSINSPDNILKAQTLLSLTEACEINDINKYATPLIKLCDDLIKQNDKDKIKLLTYKAHAYNNLGFMYKKQGLIEKAIIDFHESIKISEKIKDHRIMADTYSNLASTYQHQGEIVAAEELHLKALKLYQQINDKEGVGIIYNNLANMYENENNLELSLKYYSKSFKIWEELNDPRYIGYTLNNIGSNIDKLGNKDSALTNYQNALAIFTDLSIVEDIAWTYNLIGRLYLEQKEFKLAEKYLLKGFEIVQKPYLIETKKNISENLFHLYKDNENHKRALYYYKLFITLNDSLKNENTQKAVVQQQAKYEYEKQKAVDDAKHEKQLAIEQEAKEKQQILTYATTGGLGLVGIFLIFVFNRLKVTRKQKGIIEEAHAELGEKNKEILDSINYAKRIQSAILPPNKVVKEYLQESFILYKPKDIVAGDFYWLETVSDESGVMSGENPTLNTQHSTTVLFAAADCTGHGVPGAMVSVVCNNGLNRSVREHNLTNPGKILDKTREIVVAEFEKSEEEVKDGMDIALCSLQGNTLHYAGAHNPLWIIRNNTETIEEIKANKQPIGKFDKPEPYITHKIELQKGDTFYIFSDGYADQFGGEKGKKMKTTNFKKLLVSVRNESMGKQRELIDEAFENWKGDLEQLDDVCIIGVRI